MDEEKLISLAQSGDTKACEILLNTYRPKMYALSLRFLKNTHDADDAVQNALIKIYLSIGKFAFRSSFATWVYTITKNCSLDLIKKARPAESIDSFSEFLYSEKDTEKEVIEADDSMRLKRIINSLPEEQRACIILKDSEGYSIEDIAAILDLPAGTVKSRIHRARAKLCELIRQADI